MSQPPYKHGDETKVCGIDCTFVTYPHRGHIDDLVVDLDAHAPTAPVTYHACACCPACHNNDACSRQPCDGGYWVTTDKVPLLKLRGMP